MRLLNTLPILLTTALLSIAISTTAQTVTDTTMMVPEEETDTTATMSTTSDEPSGSTVTMEPGVGGPSITPVRKFYVGGGFDAAIFQTSFLRRPGRNNELTYLRFSYFVNLGINLNYDFDNNFGVFTGLGIKNIGFTQKESDSTIKRRAYTIGAPLGFKIGNLQRNKYVLIGGGIDVPFNYREKGWKDRHHKTKMSEWFSDYTEDVMPYLFIGGSFKKSLTLKLQYYPSNFLNSEHENVGNDGIHTQPFKGWDTRLIYLSVGMNMNYKNKGGGSHMRHKKHSEEKTEE